MVSASGFRVPDVRGLGADAGDDLFCRPLPFARRPGDRIARTASDDEVHHRAVDELWATCRVANER
jgi:hypothetical protein